jgi:hypothetical protein
MGADSKTS